MSVPHSIDLDAFDNLTATVGANFGLQINPDPDVNGDQPDTLTHPESLGCGR
jgi:hypothetical protein